MYCIVLYLFLVLYGVVSYCIVLYCIVLYCIVLYCFVLYCIVLYCIVLYCIVLYCILLYCIVLYYIVLHCFVLHCFVLYFIVLYCIVLYCIVLYCIVLYCNVLILLRRVSSFSCIQKFNYFILQGIMISMCLQGIVDEIIREGEGRPIRMVNSLNMIIKQFSWLIFLFILRIHFCFYPLLFYFSFFNRLSSLFFVSSS